MDRFVKSIAGVSIVLALFMVSLLTGCSEEDPAGPAESKLDSLQIISRPIAPQPGEATFLSVRLYGSSSGVWPSYRWTVSEGELAIDNEAVVEWSAPEESGDYEVTLEVTLDDKNLTLEKTVSVRNYELIDTGRRYNLHPRVIGGELFFVSPYNSSLSFNDKDYVNSNVLKYIGPAQSEVITDGLYSVGRSERGGDSWVFTEDGTKVIGSMINDYNDDFNQQHKNVAAYNLSGSGGIDITNSLAGIPEKWRYDQYNDPFPNDDASMVVMQYVKAGLELAGTKDLFNIGFWKPGFPQTPEILTKSADSTFIVAGEDTIWLVDYYENALPMITPDDGNIVYFTNRTGVFEPCVIPIEGGEPDTSGTVCMEMLRGMGIRITRSTIFEWQPNGNRAAFIAFHNMENTLCFMQYDPPSDISFEVSGVTDISEFAWSPGGDAGAVITGSGISIVTPMGEPVTMVLKKEHPNDKLFGVNWSPVSDLSNPKLGFRLGRPSQSWTESFNSVMIYSENASGSVLSYVTKGYEWPDDLEPNSVDYRWKRVSFSADGEEVYSPMVIGEIDPGGQGENPLYGSIRIIRSRK